MNKTFKKCLFLLDLYLTLDHVFLYPTWSFVLNSVSIFDVIESPWQSVLDLVRQECNDYFGLTILDTVGFDGLEEGYALLTVPDELRENWVNAHYGDILRKAFKKVFGTRFVDYRIRQIAPSAPVPEMRFSAPVAPPIPAAPRARKVVKRRPKLKLYPEYTFENFVEGECNATAYKACKSVSENPGDPGLNPLFVYGASGLGKTHLLQSIATSIQKNRPDAKIVYCHAYDFLRDATAVAKILKSKTGNAREMAEAFQEKYENCDILLLDDVQLLENGIRSQERLAILIRHLRAVGKQVVLSCDCHPSEFTIADTKEDAKKCVYSGIRCVSTKLLAPIESCVAVGIDEPDLQTRMRLIQKKGVSVPFVDRDREEIYRFLSIPRRQNVRVIEGMLHWLGAMNLFCQENLDLNAVKRLTAPNDSASRTEISLKGIAETVAFEFETDLIALGSKRQDAKIALPRKIAMFLCREMTSESLQNVGAIFNRDYATVIAAIQSLKKQMESDETLARRVQDIRYLLEA